MQRLKDIWFKRRSRYLAVNLIVGAASGIVVGYVGYSVAINLFDFDFLFGPYGSPDRSSIFQFLDVEASDPRWLGMLKGAGNTIAVVVFAIFLSSMLGLAVGVARLSSNPMVNRLGKLYVDLFRNLPLLLIMFFFAFAVSRGLPKIEERSGWSGVLYISNRGLAIPWLEPANSLWWLWPVALLGAATGAWLVRRSRARREAKTGESLRPNVWGTAVFVLIGAVAYAALLFPVRLTLPDVTQSASGFFSYTGGNLLGVGYLSALVSLTLYLSAYIAEIVRGSLQAVPHGQTEASASLGRHSPDRTTFPGYSSRRDAANYNLAFQGRQMRPDSLKFLLSWTNHRPAKRKISKPLVYDQVSSLGSPFALYDPVTVINPDAPKVD